MKEKDFQGMFGLWAKSASAKAAGGSALRQGRFIQSVETAGLSLAFELKLAKRGHSIQFRQIEEHQVEGLQRVEGSRPGKILFHKLSDLSLGRKPFDCFLLRGEGWFVFGWHDWRKVGGKGGGTQAGKVIGGVAVVAVRVGAYEAMRARLEGEGRKSFKQAEAEEVGEYVGILKGSGELVRP